MAHRLFATTRARPLGLVPAWALALLLLLTQHWGLIHGLGHGLAGRHGQAMAPAGQVASAAGQELAADPAADALCSTCLVLATLGALAPPQPSVWLAAPAPAAAPAAPVPSDRPVAGAAPFHARAPPAWPVFA